MLREKFEGKINAMRDQNRVEFKNAEEFYSNWAQGSIPFMGDFRI